MNLIIINETVINFFIPKYNKLSSTIHFYYLFRPNNSLFFIQLVFLLMIQIISFLQLQLNQQQILIIKNKYSAINTNLWFMCKSKDINSPACIIKTESTILSKCRSSGCIQMQIIFIFIILVPYWKRINLI
jgi:hypothetical protein